MDLCWVQLPGVLVGSAQLTLPLKMNKYNLTVEELEDLWAEKGFKERFKKVRTPSYEFSDRITSIDNIVHLDGKRISAFTEEETRELILNFLSDNPDYPQKALMGKIIELSDRNAQPQDVIKILKEQNFSK